MQKYDLNDRDMNKIENKLKGLSNAIKNLETDDRLAHQGRAKIVTDKDLASVKDNTQLNLDLERIFGSHQGTDNELIKKFKQKIIQTLGN